MRNINLKFNGTKQLVEYLQANNRENAQSHIYTSESFCRYSWDETMQALNGWKESESIKINADKITIEGNQKSTSVSYNVTGDFLDVGAYMTGEPECWGVMIEEPKPMKRVSIMIDADAHGGISSTEIENRGSAIIAMIDALKKAGYYLDITVAVSGAKTDISNGFDIFDFTISFDSDNGYSRDALAFFIAHPGFLRRIVFAAMEIETNHDDLSGYGSARASDPKGFDLAIKPIYQDFVGVWSTMEGAQKQAEDMMLAFIKGR